MVRNRVLWGASALAGSGLASIANYHSFLADGAVHVDLFDPLPTRNEALYKLFSSTPDKQFDVLVIGGGATGVGIALDAQTRGLRTALLEQEDFAAGASSRSTKLVHGGVRYLEKAVFKLDPRQLNLVTEALKERALMLHNAPHLAKPLPIITPCYKWWEVPYYWAGLKAYDLFAFGRGLTNSHYVSAEETLRMVPTLARTHNNGHSLKGSIVYYDGQFDDARYNLAIALTAALAGAVLANHVKVSGLIKDSKGQVVGAMVKDSVAGGKERAVYAKVVVNATGPFTDGVRQMSKGDCAKMIQPSAGAHVTLPDYYANAGVGMIIPKTKDGRVLFMLPWQDKVIAGTTDAEYGVTMTPQAGEDEVQFILDALSEYLALHVRRQDVLATWSGIRPLAIDPTAANTADAVREHVVVEEPDGLITCAGGKWTTYRKMAEDTVDAVCQSGKLGPCKRCVTNEIKLVGSAYHYPTLYTDIAQRYSVPELAGVVDTAVATHLADSYGDRSQEVLKLALESNLAGRLIQHHPILEAEVVWACRNELCETPEDFLARRSRLAFLDKAAAEKVLPRVVELMGKEKGWWFWRRWSEQRRTQRFLSTFESARPAAPAPATAKQKPDTTAVPPGVGDLVQTTMKQK